MRKKESVFYDSLYWSLLSGREPKVVAGLEDFEKLSHLISEGSRKDVRRILEKQANGVVTYWMRMLGAKRGRARDRELREKWALAELAERRGFKRTQLIPLIDAGGDLDAARDRLGKGIRAIRKERRTVKGRQTEK